MVVHRREGFEIWIEWDFALALYEGKGSFEESERVALLVEGGYFC